MPRLQAPEGFYTASEARQRLNVSDAVVRAYVQKGRIRYVVPPGRKQGFYLKRDVDGIVNEITAFLSMSLLEENDTLTFNLASKEDLLEIARIDNTLFSTVTSDEDTPEVPAWRYKFLEKTPETQFVLKNGDTIIGYAGMLPFRTDLSADTWTKILTCARVADTGITEDDIESLEEGKHIHLYITGLGLDKSVPRHKRSTYGARLINALVDRIVELGRRGVFIDGATAGGATTIGAHLLQAFGMHEVPPRVPGRRVFTMNIWESGSHASMQYKEALAKWKQEHPLATEQ